MKTLFFLSLFLILGCSADYHFKKSKNVTPADLLFQKIYEDSIAIEPNYHRNDNQILLVFSTIGFANSNIIVNKKDTIKFQKLESNDCAKMKLLLVDKNNKNLFLESNGMPNLKIKILENYNYIKVDKIYEKKWDITYSYYFPFIMCY